MMKIYTILFTLSVIILADVCGADTIITLSANCSGPNSKIIFIPSPKSGFKIQVSTKNEQLEPISFCCSDGVVKVLGQSLCANITKDKKPNTMKITISAEPNSALSFFHQISKPENYAGFTAAANIGIVPPSVKHAIEDHITDVNGYPYNGCLPSVNNKQLIFNNCLLSKKK